MANHGGVPFLIVCPTRLRPAEWWGEGASLFVLISIITMNTLKVRAVFTKSHAQLRAARREHIDQRRHAIVQSQGNALLHATITEMIGLGLYAKPLQLPKSDRSFHDYRFSLVRAIWQIEKSIWGKDAVGEWFFWLKRNGFDLSFGRNLKPERKQA